MSDFASYSDAATRKGFIDPVTRTGQVQIYAAPLIPIDRLDAEDIHEIGEAEKRAIFGRQLREQDSQAQRARLLHGRLLELCPGVAARFAVKEDALERTTFRLWAQRESEDAREDSYVALSYCWDEANFPLRPDVPYALPVGAAMFSAIARERQWRTTGIWIDQLCIDQGDEAEKAVSVAAMDSVYRGAMLVVVALADVEVPLAQQAFLRDFIPKYEAESATEDNEGLTPFLRQSPRFFEKHPVLHRLLGAILRSRYFTRAWCCHEMELGENFVFYAPCQPRPDAQSHDAVELLAFSPTFLWDLLMLSAEVPAEDEQTDTVRDSLIKVFNMHRRIGRAYQALTGKQADHWIDPKLVQPYTSQIRTIFALGARGNPRLPAELRKASAHSDKTSIVLNTLGTGLAVAGDLDPGLTEDGSIKRLMILALAANDATVLCTLGSPLKSAASSDISSWLCKPTWCDLGSGSHRQDHLAPMLPELAKCFRLDTSEALSWVELDVMALGSPQPPTERFRSIASQLTQKMIELGMGRGPPGLLGDLGAQYVGKTDLQSRIMLMTLDLQNVWGTGPLYQYWHSQTFLGEARERFNWTIACLLQCGVDWILGTARRCGYPDPQFLGTKIHSYFEDDEFTGIEDMTWSASEAGREAIDAVFSAAMWVLSWGALRPHKRADGFMPMLFPHGVNGKAVLFTVADALMQVVMPGPLLMDDYSRLYRIWLLQAKDDPFYEKMMRGQTPHWFLRAKAILFTNLGMADIVCSEGSARDGKPGWRLRESVRVHGPPPEFCTE